MVRHEHLRRLLGDDGLVEFARRIQQRDITPRQSDSLEMKIALTAYGNWAADKAVTRDRIKRIQDRVLSEARNEPTHHYADNT